MNVSYKREMRHNYLILEAMEEEESFEIRMLTGNAIEGLLKFRVKQEEKANYYYYEITSKQPLSRLLEFKEIEKKELSTLILEIGAVLKRIEDYLLSESNLFLAPEHIYIEPESYQVWLCYIPGYEKSFPDAMAKLLQYLLKKTNHKDNDTVVLAYRLYQESQKDYYGIEDLLRIVRESQKECSKETINDKQKIKAIEAGNAQFMAGELLSEDFHEEIPEKRNDKSQNPGKRQEKEAERKKGNLGKNFWMAGIKLFVGYTGFLLLGPLVIWLYAGIAGLRQYRMILCLVDSLIVLSTVVYWLKKGQKSPEREKRKQRENQEKWQMVFEEEVYQEEAEEGMEGEGGSSEGERLLQNWENLDVGNEENENTVLLAEVSLDGEQVHLLKSVNPSISDIPIPYFPFIIGKQEGIVDYVLKKDTISRIHLRLDEKDGVCQVTDLNSSNGTSVGDYRLEANEMRTLSCGDQLIIADISFIFY